MSNLVDKSAVKTAQANIQSGIKNQYREKLVSTIAEFEAIQDKLLSYVNNTHSSIDSYLLDAIRNIHDAKIEIKITIKAQGWNE